MTQLIQIKQSTTYPDLYIHKYHRKVFYDNLWNEDPQLVESRGRVYDRNGKVVINPPTKVFNRNENGTDIDADELCLAVEKINGFMACVTWVPEVNDVVVSTTGSLDSDYVQMARSMMPRVINVIRKEKLPITYIFEVCHSNDPHIIPENIGIYLLGARKILYPFTKTPYFSTLQQEEFLDDKALHFKVARPAYFLDTMQEISKLAKTCKHEGYMVYGQTSGTALKLKSPYYLSLKAMARSKDILSLKRNRVDEEYYPLLDHLIELGDTFSTMKEQDKLDYIRNWLYKSVE